MARSRLAQIRYGDLPALVSPTPSRPVETGWFSGHYCAVETIPLADLAEWCARHNVRPVRAIGHNWPPMVLYEEIPDAD